MIITGAGAAKQALYRSIDDGAAPVWDEFVPTPAATDYGNKSMGENSPGEWNWWNLNPRERPVVAVKDEFFDPTIDYESFETKSDRELLDNKNMILSDRRSCPFSDTMKCKTWLSEPHGIEFLPEKIGYIPSLTPKTDLDIEIEKLLAKKKAKIAEPWSVEKRKKDLWDKSHEFAGCPFEKVEECKIWKAKPAFPETGPHQPAGIPRANLDALITLARAGNEITAKMPDAKPLVRRYEILMKSARACCGDGMVNKLQVAGATTDLIYKFLVDDANFYQFGERCLMITDGELDENYADTQTAEVVADVRNECLCRRRDFFAALLSPFAQVAAAAPEFNNAAFNYSYRDGLGRILSVSIARDVKVVLDQLNNCP
jgi:hypothetical protein